MRSVHSAHPLSAGSSSWATAPKARAASRYGPLLFTAAVVLFAALRLWHLADPSLSFDEIFSIHAVRHSWVGLIQFVILDLVHPPLFYLLLKMWVAIGGESVFWLRLFPTLLAVFSILPLLQICRELNLDPAEKTSALVLVATNGFLIYYSHLLRMYSLLLLLGLCSIWLFLRLYKAEEVQPRSFWATFIVNLLLVYTHYFGWILIAAELLVLARRPNRKFLSFLGSTALVAICFGIWVYAVAEVYVSRGLSQNLGWINQPHLSTLAAFFATLNDKPFDFRWSGRLGLLLFGAPIIIAGARYLFTARKVDEPTDNSFWLLSIFAFVPVLIVFLASSLPIQSIWLPRGLLFAAVPYLILVVVSASRLRPRWISALTLALLIGWSVMAGFATLNWRSNAVRMDQWVQNMMEAEEGETGKIRFYALDEHTPYYTWFYLNSANQQKFQVVLVKDATSRKADKEEYWLTAEMFPAVEVKALGDLEGDHFWVGFSEEQWNDELTPQEILSQAGYRVGPGFEGGPPHKRTFLFPVWRKSIS